MLHCGDHSYFLMNHRLPKHYTILISCTGKAPVTLSFRPLALLSGLIVSIALPTLAIATAFYSYAHKNTVLTQRNTLLTQEATDILTRLESLETKINSLQQRAGVSNPSPTPANNSANPQGGEEVAVQAEALLEEAKAILPNLSQNLNAEVAPALEQILVREEARPYNMPLKVPTEVTSPFGLRPNPFGWGFEFHNGLDFKGDYGTPIHVTASGVVQMAGWDSGYGYHVIVEHGYGYQTLYAHLSKIEVSQGDRIKRDQVLGYLGSTGRSSGPHVHYTVYHDGVAVDPRSYLR